GGPAGEDVVASGLDAGEDGEAAAGEDADLVPEPPPDHVGERQAALEQRAGTGDLEREQVAEARVHAARGERLVAPGAAREILLRQVDAAAVEVARHVLPEVGQLERRADVVGAALARGVAMAEEREHEPPDGIGRAAAVAEQVGEGGEATGLAGGVATERLEEVAEVLVVRARDAGAVRVGGRHLDAAGLAAPFRRHRAHAVILRPWPPAGRGTGRAPSAGSSAGRGGSGGRSGAGSPCR